MNAPGHEMLVALQQAKDFLLVISHLTGVLAVAELIPTRTLKLDFSCFHHSLPSNYS